MDYANNVDASCNISDSADSFFNPVLFLDEPLLPKQFIFGQSPSCLTVDLLGLHHVSRAIPYYRIGHHVWPSSLVLSELLVQQPELVEGKRVLELGSGLGLVGIVAAKLCKQPKHVVVTDGDETILPTTANNIAINFKGLPSQQLPKTGHLLWGEALDSFQCCHGQFDVILGADLIYEIHVDMPTVPLFETVRHLLVQSPDSVFLTGYQKRYPELHEELIRVSSQKGFIYKEVDVSQLKVLCQKQWPEEPVDAVHVYSFSIPSHTT